ELVKQQVKDYHKYNDLIREGDYYRLVSYSENKFYDSYMIVSKDKKKALVFYIQVLARPSFRSIKLKLKGLDKNMKYKIQGKDYTGDILMNCGILIPSEQGDFKSKIIVLEGE
ncbi:MAG: GH36 C-terminal domain-containing protein, partial [Eubacteriales bacterium]|nr:GH36 C-terminal domain-containing protein [Eubacteriales bacterium]